MVPDLGPGSRVMDVGSGTGCLIPHMHQMGIQDILAVDLAEALLAKVAFPFTVSKHILLLIVMYGFRLTRSCHHERPFGHELSYMLCIASSVVHCHIIPIGRVH